jgi:hypothetical protein
LMKNIRLLIIALNVLGIVYNSCYLASIVYQCIPLSYYWQRLDPGKVGICFDPTFGVKMTIMSTVIGALTDWIFGLLPIYLLWNLQMSKQKKIGVCFLLCLGIL